MTKSIFFWLYALLVSNIAGASFSDISNHVVCCSGANIDPDSLKIMQLVGAWNNAVNNNQLEKLNDIYADQVVYYLNDFTRQQCIDSKTSWLSKHKDYSQKLEEIEQTRYYKGNKTIIMVGFKKGYSNNGITAVVGALLEFEYIGKGWKIVKESDAATESKRFKEAGPITLPKGEYYFSGGLYVNTEDEKGDLTYSLSLNIGDEITGSYDFWSYITRTSFNYTITKAKMENGILELSLVFNEESGTPREDEEELETELRFKIIGGKELHELDDEIPVSLFLEEKEKGGK